MGVVAGLAAPAEAGGKGRWNVRLFGSFLTTGGDRIVEPPVTDVTDCFVAGECYSVDAKDGNALGLNVEFRVTRHRWGVELGGLSGEQDVSFGFLLFAIPTSSAQVEPEVTEGFIPMSVDFQPIYLAGNYHVLKEESIVDFYVGLVVANVGYGKDRVSFLGENYEFDFDDGTGIGLNLAFDVYVAKHWFLGGGLRFLKVDSDFTIVDTATGQLIFSDTLQMDPYIFSFGGGARF
jgi:outer membrane protein W